MGNKGVFVAIVVETVGYEEPRIVAISAVKKKGAETVEKFDSFVNPEIGLSDVYLKAKRLKASQIYAGPTIDQVRVQLLEFVDTLPIITYDAPTFLELLMENAPPSFKLKFTNPVLDLLDLALLAVPTLPNHTLSELVKYFELDNHLPEPEILAQLFFALSKKLKELPPHLLGELHRLTEPISWSCKPLIKQIIDEAGQNSKFSLAELAKSYTHQGIARKSPVIPPKLLDLESIKSNFYEDGAIARKLENYELRKGQIDMAVCVAEAFNGGNILIAEAGTGIGKSLAYLVPAVYWAKQNRQPVVISTHTKNLQEQLYKKDIPLLNKVLGVDFQAALLKGRNNYICLRRFGVIYEEHQASLLGETILALAYLLVWLAQTKSGDCESISPSAIQRFPQLNEILDGLRSESDACLGKKCPWYESCFVESARKLAEAADIIVVNHALVFTNYQTPIVPPFAHLVLDEAHNLEDVATQHLGYELNHWELLRGLRKLYNPREEAGVLVYLLSKLRFMHSRMIGEKLMEKAEAVIAVIPGLVDAINDFSGRIREFMDSNYRKSMVPSLGVDYSQKLRLTEPILGTVQPLGVLADNLLLRMKELTHRLGQLLEGLRSLKLQTFEAQDDFISELSGALEHWQRVIETINFIMAVDDNSYVYWMESSEKNAWRLKAAPIEVGDKLDEFIYAQLDTVILTSATLTVAGSFRYLRQRLGLNGLGERVVEFAVGSPFDYPKRVLLCIPTDLPEPTEPKFTSQVARFLESLLSVARGNALILSTSREVMNKLYELVKPVVESKGIMALCQYHDGPRYGLTELLKASADSVLFGTRSFWEGVDLPGEALQCLVIVKLPFPVPDDPVIEARAEYLQAQGIDSRREYYEPQAIIRFRQGFGRLIRSKSDYGAVVILDKRLLSRAYGRRFLDSIPRCSFKVGGSERLYGEIKRWLGSSLKYDRGVK